MQTTLLEMRRTCIPLQLAKIRNTSVMEIVEIFCDLMRFYTSLFSLTLSILRQFFFRHFKFFKFLVLSKNTRICFEVS